MNNYLQSTTQNYLEIFDVTNDLVILKDGSVALVLAVGSLNFGLLAEEEQDAIIYSYAGLLNSLTFPIEVVIRSQKKDVTTYLKYVKEWEDKVLSPLRKTQIRRYREFVGELVKERRILDKKFYVAIPFKSITLDKSIVPQIKKKESIQFDRAYVLERALTDLEPKRDHLIAQFGRIGLAARQLNTQELIQLLYTIYNPGSYEGQKMGDTRSYTTAMVEASLSGVAKQPSLQQFTQDVESPIQQGLQTQPTTIQQETATQGEVLQETTPQGTILTQTEISPSSSQTQAPAEVFIEEPGKSLSSPQ